MSLFFIQNAESMAQAEPLRGAKAVGVDLETAGPNGLEPRQSRIRLLQMAAGSDCFVFDLDKVDPWPLVQPILESPDVVKAFHHAKFDVKHLMHHRGVAPRNLFCTMLASKLLAKGRRGVHHSLADAAKRFLHKVIDKEPQRSDWSGALSETQVQYAGHDAELALRLYQRMDARLREEKMHRVSQLEFRTVIPTAAMELRGVYVDQERLTALERSLREQCDALAAAVHEELELGDALPGVTVLNLNAPDQVRQALHDKGIHVRDTTDAQLRPLAEQYAFIDDFLKYRHLSKVVGVTVRALRDHVLPETGRVHSTYHQISSASGRFACSDPNIQQVPRDREVRACVRPAPGYAYIIADYSQVELRVAASLSKDPIMLKAYSEGADLHRVTAALTKGKAVEDVTSTERQAAKAINFGLIYAMGPRGLQQSALSSYGVEMTFDDAVRFRERFFQIYKGIYAWQRRMERLGHQRRYVRTAAGRIRAYEDQEIRLPELLNTPVQGSAAEGLKSAMCIFWQKAKEQKLDAQIVAVIHDEIIVEVACGQEQAAKELLERAMVEGIQWLAPDVPFVAEAVIAESWAVK